MEKGDRTLQFFSYYYYNIARYNSDIEGSALKCNSYENTIIPESQVLHRFTLNMSNRISFLTSSLSKGCFSFMMFLQRFSSAGNSVLDTPLHKQTRTKETQINYSDIHIL